VFGFAFETTFCFSKSQKPTKRTGFYLLWRWTTSKKLPTATFKKLMILNYLTVHSPQQLFHSLQLTAIFSKVTAQPNTSLIM